jgi:hypothetical protein
MTAEVAKVIAQVPPVISSLTGVDLEGLLKRVREAPPADAPDAGAGAPSPAPNPPAPPAASPSLADLSALAPKPKPPTLR